MSEQSKSSTWRLIRATPITLGLVVLSLGVETTAATRPTTGPAAPVEIEELRVTPPAINSNAKRTTVLTRGGPDLRVYLFAPQTQGATSKAHPTFYWYLTKQVEDDTEIVLATVQMQRAGNKAERGQVLMRRKHQGTQPPGIYAVTLSDKALEPGKLYQLSVIVHRGEKGQEADNISATGYVVFNAPAKDDGALADPRSCAGMGLWYDAIHAAMRRIAADPKDPTPHRQLHGLLASENVFYSDPGESASAADKARARREYEDFFKQLAARNNVVVKPEQTTEDR
jgi:hypothetical protein